MQKRNLQLSHNPRIGNINARTWKEGLLIKLFNDIILKSSNNGLMSGSNLSMPRMKLSEKS